MVVVCSLSVYDARTVCVGVEQQYPSGTPFGSTSLLKPPDLPSGIRVVYETYCLFEEYDTSQLRDPEQVLERDNRKQMRKKLGYYRVKISNENATSQRHLRDYSHANSNLAFVLPVEAGHLAMLALISLAANRLMVNIWNDLI